jgi:hypothetical protein
MLWVWVGLRDMRTEKKHQGVKFRKIWSWIFGFFGQRFRDFFRKNTGGLFLDRGFVIFLESFGVSVFTFFSLLLHFKAILNYRLPTTHFSLFLFLNMSSNSDSSNTVSVPQTPRGPFATDGCVWEAHDCLCKYCGKIFPTLGYCEYQAKYPANEGKERNKRHQSQNTHQSSGCVSNPNLNPQQKARLELRQIKAEALLQQGKRIKEAMEAQALLAPQIAKVAKLEAQTALVKAEGALLQAQARVAKHNPTIVVKEVKVKENRLDSALEKQEEKIADTASGAMKRKKVVKARREEKQYLNVEREELAKLFPLPIWINSLQRSPWVMARMH